jgi:hypothetical protein
MLGRERRSRIVRAPEQFSLAPCHQFSQEADNPLETKLHLIVAAFLVAAAYAKHSRELREEAEKRRWEAQQEAWRQEERRKAELARKKALRDQAHAWHEAAEIRRYVVAVRKAVQDGTFNGPGEDLSMGDLGARAY